MELVPEPTGGLASCENKAKRAKGIFSHMKGGTARSCDKSDGGKVSKTDLKHGALKREREDVPPQYRPTGGEFK